MDVSDTTKQVMEMLEFEPESPTQFFVLDKFTGKQYVSFPSDRMCSFQTPMLLPQAPTIYGLQLTITQLGHIYRQTFHVLPLCQRL